MKEVIKTYRVPIIISIILISISALAIIIQPNVIADVIEALSETNAAGQNDPDIDAIYYFGYLLIALGLLSLFTSVVNTFLASKAAIGIGTDLRKKVFSKIQSFSFGDIDKFSTSNLVVRMTNDITQIQNFVMLSLQIVMRVPIMFFGGFILAVINFPQLWWTLILYVIIVIVILVIALKRMAPLFMTMQGEIDGVNSIVKENMSGVRVVKSFVTEEKEQNRFTVRVISLTDKILKTGTTFATIIPLFMLTANLLTAIAIYFTATWALNDPSLIAQLIAFTTYLMQIMFALVMTGMLSMTFSRAFVSMRRVNEVIDTESTLIYGDEKLKTVKEISFNNVDFTYPNADETTLHAIDLTIKRGEKIGIVGSTGSGKSTLVNLISRLYDVTGGELTFNGEDVKRYDHKSLTNAVALIAQKAILFRGTIEDTLRQGGKDLSDDELLDYARQAQALEFIEKKDGKLEAEVYEQGNNFSGGQKQRLNITRGLAKNADVIIFDDSTSALDARSEKLVKTAINEEMGDKTVVLVAQKIASVVDMDRIVVMNEGTIDSIGTHKELIEKSAVYREIYRTQKAKEVN